MDVRCEKCGTEYEFDVGRVGAHGVTVKCTACGHVFKVHNKSIPSPKGISPSSDAPGPREWLVRKPDRRMIAFRELTTLQKWIVEGRIGRDDEISKNSETWKRLGNISELEPFFTVYEKARALNDLMATGSIGERPIVLNGSEVLATMSPMSSVSLAAASLPPTAPAMPSPATPAGMGAARSSGALSTVPPPPVATIPPPLKRPSKAPDYAAPARRTPSGPAEAAGHRDPTASDQLAAAMPRAATPAPQGHDVATERNLKTPRANGTPLRRSAELSEARQDPTADFDFGGGSIPSIPLPGPGALGFTPSSIGEAADLDDERESGEDHILRGFEKEQRRKRALVTLAVIVTLGLAGGAGFALLGPDDNPLRVLAARWGLSRGAAPAPDPVQALIEAATRDAELDTFATLEQAAGELERASEKRPDDATLIADRALVLITWADELRRSALEDEAEAATAPNLKSAAVEKRAKASDLMRRAFELARGAHTRAPDVLPVARALAEYYRVQQDNEKRMDPKLAAAKAAAQSAGLIDAATLYIEAAAIAGDLVAPSPAALEQASRLLEQALTSRPTLLRARVLLARIQASRGAKQLAAAELQRVLDASPGHTEAKRLHAKLTKPAVAPTATATAAAPKPVVAAAPAPPPAAAAAPAPSPAAGAPPPAAPAPAAAAANLDWMAQGDRLRESGNAWKALLAYEKAADRKQHTAEAYAGKGWCYIDLGKPAAAVTEFRRSLAANDRFAEANFGLGEAFRAMGKSDDALQAYRRYLAANPSGPDANAAKRSIQKLEAGGGDAPKPEPAPSE